MRRMMNNLVGSRLVVCDGWVANEEKPTAGCFPTVGFWVFKLSKVLTSCPILPPGETLPSTAVTDNRGASAKPRQNLPQ